MLNTYRHDQLVEKIANEIDRACQKEKSDWRGSAHLAAKRIIKLLSDEDERDFTEDSNLNEGKL